MNLITWGSYWKMTETLQKPFKTHILRGTMSIVSYGQNCVALMSAWSFHLNIVFLKKFRPLKALGLPRNAKTVALCWSKYQKEEEKHKYRPWHSFLKVITSFSVLQSLLTNCLSVRRGGLLPNHVFNGNFVLQVAQRWFQKVSSRKRLARKIYWRKWNRKT